MSNSGKAFLIYRKSNFHATVRQDPSCKSKKLTNFMFASFSDGIQTAPGGTRTPDPRITNALLYRLSHGSDLENSKSDCKKAAALFMQQLHDPSGNRTRVYGVRGRRLDRLTNGPVNRGDRIRTCDLCVPNAALYQTEPRLDYVRKYNPQSKKCQHLFSNFFKQFIQ